MRREVTCGEDLVDVTEQLDKLSVPFDTVRLATIARLCIVGHGNVSLTKTKPISYVAMHTLERGFDLLTGG